MNRGLGTFSSFAVAFSYISPSTGIFTLFFLGMSALGARLFWTWPVVAVFQFIVALNFAEVTSHFPLAGSVYQWTKYLSGRGYAWITGWFYVCRGSLRRSVCATLPISLIAALNYMFGWHLNDTLGSADQKVVAVITLVLITVLNIYGVKLVAIINNTGVILRDPRHGRVRGVPRGGAQPQRGGGDLQLPVRGQLPKLPRRDHDRVLLVGMFMSLYVIYGFDTASTLARRRGTRAPRRRRPSSRQSSARS